jgi:DNA-binding MarR family transcriptional regulator
MRKPLSPVAMAPREYQVFNYIKKTGSISARDALIDLDMTSASLARRIVDLERHGYTVIRSQKEHPVNKRPYTRYSIIEAVQ